ncbi:hypothetical protein BGW80DRAFT_1434319 [Lactifluus volemus]|nr:hypothetical protein BGW80DRAFT_1434319 [Lactifluus volemus]
MGSKKNRGKRNKTVQEESAAVLEEIQAKQAIAPEKPNSSSKNGSKRDRKAATLAEKQPPINIEADARLEREAKEEGRAISRMCNELGLEIHEINPDGHCLFSAVADHFPSLTSFPHPDDFMPFLPSVEGEHGTGPGSSIGPREYAHYCATIRDTSVWGGEPEIRALSHAYAVPIHVVQGGQPPVVVHDPNGTPSTANLKEQRAVRISYHRRMYGLGEHYNSLRPRTGLQKITGPLRNLLAPQ